MKIIIKYSFLVLLSSFLIFCSDGKISSEKNIDSNVQNKILNIESTGEENLPSAQLDTIGELSEENNPIITANIEELLSNYNTNLKKYAGIEGNFTNVSIFKTDNIYILMFSGDIYTSYIPVIVHGESLSGNPLLIANGGTSCSTTDCSSENTGCVPKTFTTGCTKCNNSGKCTRTTTRGFSLLKFQSF